MADLQLRLLPAPQPLVERLGSEFFRGVPTSPGVYRLFDATGRLLYVGKAGNLRARLASYRRTRGQSRKTVRLLHAAHRIEWELCSSETAARLLENDLIRTLRPRFNRAGVWPRSARYIQLSFHSPPIPASSAPLASEVMLAADPSPRGDNGPPEVLPGFDLRLVHEPLPDPGIETFGAFRAGAAFALGALARLFWLAWNPAAQPHELPHSLVTAGARRTLQARHPQAEDWIDDLRRFLLADDDRLIARLIAAVPEPTSPFDRAFVAAQFETLASFFRQGPLRHRHLREAFAPDTTVLPPERLDDLLILAGPLNPSAPPFRPEP